SGGYFGSAVDQLLPVSMELREDHMKLSAAVAIVIDKSGSMGASVPGMAGMMKINLAAEGAAKSIELLGPNDWCTVIAVDSMPEWIFNLKKVGPERADLASKVRRLAVGGGGIYCYTGLKAAYDTLDKATSGTRHVILFADAADAEEPGDYINMLAEMRKKGITVSVIGMGTPADSDALFLEDVAKRGGGRMFYSKDSADLPAIFSQEVVAVARSAFIEDKTKVQPNQGWLTIASGTTEWLPQVDGYNLSYLRPKATGGVASVDEYKAPLVSFWPRGAGRTAAVLFPISGEFSTLVRDWKGYGDFLQTITRWTVGQEMPPGTQLKTRVDGTEMTIEFYYGQTWESKIALHPPKLLLSEGTGKQGQEHVWQRIAPGRYEAKVNLTPSSVVRGSVLIEKEAIPFGPIVSGSNPEWAVDRARIVELQNTATLSGGQQRLELSEIWSSPRDPGSVDIRPLLLWFALATLVMDILWTRIGWSTRWPWQSGTRKPPNATTPPTPAAVA
ncbi:MAG: VWA domain-containing protein, partial [Candidatus Methylacidiphilales bacterium]